MESRRKRSAVLIDNSLDLAEGRQRNFTIGESLKSVKIVV
jgi:hypothetical protein